MSFQTPILFLAFNRPSTTEKVFEAIRKAQPTKLYLSCDAARSDQERVVVDKVKEIVSKVDWDCDVKTRFQENNLGCKLNVSSSIDWFFSLEEEGIILEDDCLPSPTFFTFAQAMLEKYRDEPKVMQISGNNYLSKDFVIEDEYYFTTINDIWGWATWRRAWKHFDLSMRGYEEAIRSNKITDYYQNKSIESWNRIYLDEGFKPGCKIWSPQWVYALIKGNGLTIAPKVNLVQNIGFLEGENIDDNFHREYGIIEAMDYSFSFDQNSPKEIKANYEADKNRFIKVAKTDLNIAPITVFKRNLRKFIYKFITAEGRKKIKSLMGIKQP